ncbi:urea transporter [Vibrio splendidus]|uniref:urea transporter n=1 Tax=Vibrio splendidus TaxID=29497 RepID=UPI000C8666C7|nr:urea transporter [Vibrio splendidus]PMJ94911.1 urea transporter [Vibrio splendidus]
MQKNKDILPLQGLLSGIGQVYFTSSVMASFLLLLAISIESMSLAFLTLFGAACSYWLAKYTYKPTQNIDNGLYALNGALVALFIGNFFGVTPWLILVTAVGALLTVPLAHIVFRFKVYLGYTSAFVLVSWLIYLIYATFNFAIFDASSTPSSLITITKSDLSDWFQPPSTVIPFLKGISQVSFINNELSGLVMLFAVAFNNAKHAMWVVTAVVISTLFSNMIGVPNEYLEQGLYGYNAVLVTLALVLYQQITWPLIIVGILFTCLITLGFHTFSLLPLTAPFIISAWAIVYLSRWINRRFSS